MKRTARGVVYLVTTTVLWGSSFSFIKLSVTDISPLAYTSLRSLIAVLALTPLLFLKKMKGGIEWGSLFKGVVIGVAYFLGLYLQAAGTVYTTPSISAFVTGLNSVHVHLYVALVERNYGLIDGVALALAILGLYLLTSPEGGFTAGVFLVFMGSIAWAAQILLVSKYGSSSTLEVLYGMFLPGALTSPGLLLTSTSLPGRVLLYLAYLAIVCSVLATFFQVVGQRYVSPLVAALIFLLEPVFALVFSLLMGLEKLELYKLVGGGLIVLATYLVTMIEVRKSRAEEP